MSLIAYHILSLAAFPAAFTRVAHMVQKTSTICCSVRVELCSTAYIWKKTKTKNKHHQQNPQTMLLEIPLTLSTYDLQIHYKTM